MSWRSLRKIPIIYYHALFDREVNRETYAISKGEFEKQMRYLHENGFRSLSLDHFFKQSDYNEKERKEIIITFDDGNFSDYSIAYPILRKFGFTATFFVTVGWVGKSDYLSWSNIKEMVNSGMSIQSHSLTHAILPRLDHTMLREELNTSKYILEKNLNSKIEYISIPDSFYSRRVLRIAKESGYKGVCTSEPGLNYAYGKNQDMRIFKRIIIMRKTSFNNFKRIVNGDLGFITAQKALGCFKLIVKKVLGTNIYTYIWSKIAREV